MDSKHDSSFQQQSQLRTAPKQWFARRQRWAVSLLLAGLAVAVWLTLDSRPAAAQAIVVTKTVGTAPLICPPTQAIAVDAGTPVYYCVTVQNTGPVSFTAYTLRDFQLGVTFTYPGLFEPGSVFTMTNATFQSLGPHVLPASLVNTALISATGAFGNAAASSSASVEVIPPPAVPAVVITKTVGLVPAGCADTQLLQTEYGAPLYYCFQIHNTGNISFSQYVYHDLELRGTFTTTGLFRPGSIITRTSANFALLGPIAATINLTNTVILTATGARGEAFSASSARVLVAPQLTLLVTKTVGTAPGQCATTTQITVTPGTFAHYCFTVRNTGNRTFENINLDDPTLGVTSTITNLLPGKGKVLTSGQIRGLGPIETLAAITNTVFVTATAAEGAVNAQASAFISVTPVIPAPAMIVTKTIANAGGACGNQKEYFFWPGTPVYYCFTIHNVGNTSFNHITFDDPSLSLYNGIVNYTLNPGRLISLTNRILRPLGPMTPTFSITNTVYMTGFGSLGVAIAQAQATATLILLPTNDFDHDGIPDSVEGEGDMDADLLPNYMDLDSDGDDALDRWEGIADRNQNGIPDFVDPTIAASRFQLYLSMIRK